MQPDIGPRYRPRLLTDMRDDLAVEISNEMRRRRLRLCDFAIRYGYSERQVEEISKYLRGEACRFGHEAALLLAEKLGIKGVALFGDEVDAFKKFVAAQARRRRPAQAVAA